MSLDQVDDDWMWEWMKEPLDFACVVGLPLEEIGLWSPPREEAAVMIKAGGRWFAQCCEHVTPVDPPSPPPGMISWFEVTNG